MGLRIGWLTIDTPHPRELARFWQDALDADIIEQDDEGDEVTLQTKGPEKWRILLYRVDEPKRVKNRLHLDLIPEDQAAEVARLEGLGARRVDIGQGDVTWVVMADPDGNEFCVLSPRSEA